MTRKKFVEYLNNFPEDSEIGFIGVRGIRCGIGTKQ